MFNPISNLSQRESMHVSNFNLYFIALGSCQIHTYFVRKIHMLTSLIRVTFLKWKNYSWKAEFNFQELTAEFLMKIKRRFIYTK